MAAGTVEDEVAEESARDSRPRRLRTQPVAVADLASAVGRENAYQLQRGATMCPEDRELPNLRTTGVAFVRRPLKSKAARRRWLKADKMLLGDDSACVVVVAAVAHRRIGRAGSVLPGVSVVSSPTFTPLA